MVKKKHSEVKREIQNPVGYPVGTVIEEFMNGSMTIHNPDGTQEFLDAQGKALSTNTDVITIEKLIEDLQKDPKNRLLQEYAKAYLKKIKYIEDDKTTAKDILDKMAELTGALEPSLNKGAKIVAIRVNFINVSEQPKEISQKAIDVEARVVEH